MKKVIINTKYPLKKSSELKKIAEMVSKFYGLDVVLDPADFSPASTHADLKIVTPSGTVVGLFHMSFFSPWDHWIFGGQTYVIGEHLEKLRQKSYLLRKKK